MNPQRYNEGASQEWIEQDQLYEICQHLGCQDWQDVYTQVDVETMFENYVVELNHNEVHQVRNGIEMQAISSGVHIGQSNWLLKIMGEQQLQKIGLVTNLCLEGDFRYPKSADLQQLQDLDCMLLNSNIFLKREIEHNLSKPLAE